MASKRCILYNMRFFHISKLLFISFMLLMLFSCADVFRPTTNIMSNAQTIDDTEPQKIFLGGNFLYSYNEVTHEALAVLDGQGNYEAGVLSSTQYGIYGDGSGYRGVRAMHFTEDSMYVAGDFRGYDSSSDGSAFTDDFQLMMRYEYNGSSLSLDETFAPLNFTLLGSSSFSAWDTTVLSSGKIAAAGDFVIGANQYFSVFNIDGTEITSPILPDISSGSYVSKLYLIDDETLLIAGTFDTIDSDSTYQNIAIIDLTTYDASIPLYDDPLDSDPLEMTDIYDVLLTTQNELYIAGRNRNAVDPDQSGVLRKYIYNETESRYEGDVDFNSAFRAELARTDEDSTSASFNQVHCLAIDSNGYIYVGGEFWNVFDVNEREHRGLLRVDSNGQIDPSFYPRIGGQVYTMAFQGNGKLLVGGNIYNINNWEVNGYFRLDEYGNLDDSFVISGIPERANQPVIYSIIVEEAAQE